MTAPQDDALDEAVLAFDAGNHAWGRFRHFVLGETPAAQGVPADDVRDALGEAAIRAAEVRETGPAPLLDAVRSTRAALRVYRGALPAETPLSEVDQAIDAFEEAVLLLERLVRAG